MTDDKSAAVQVTNRPAQRVGAWDLLWQVPDPATPSHDAAIGAELTEQDAQQRGLARAIRARDRQAIARADHHLGQRQHRSATARGAGRAPGRRRRVTGPATTRPDAAG